MVLISSSFYPAELSLTFCGHFVKFSKHFVVLSWVVNLASTLILPLKQRWHYK